MIKSGGDEATQFRLLCIARVQTCRVILRIRVHVYTLVQYQRMRRNALFTYIAGTALKLRVERIQ